MESVYKVTTDQIKSIPLKVKYDEKIEEAVNYLKPCLQNIVNDDISSRWVALRLIEGNVEPSMLLTVFKIPAL